MTLRMYVKNKAWEAAGLGIAGPIFKTEETFTKEMRYHDLVVEYLANHKNDENFRKNFYYPNGHIKYFKILDLAEKELRRVM